MQTIRPALEKADRRRSAASQKPDFRIWEAPKSCRSRLAGSRLLPMRSLSTAAFRISQVTCFSVARSCVFARTSLTAREYVFAPRLISTIFEKIVEINRDRKISILLVEQNANLALEISSHAYVLETGSLSMDGASADLRMNPQLKAAYLGGYKQPK